MKLGVWVFGDSIVLHRQLLQQVRNVPCISWQHPSINVSYYGDASMMLGVWVFGDSIDSMDSCCSRRETCHTGVEGRR